MTIVVTIAAKPTVACADVRRKIHSGYCSKAPLAERWSANYLNGLIHLFKWRFGIGRSLIRCYGKLGSSWEADAGANKSSAELASCEMPGR